MSDHHAAAGEVADDRLDESRAQAAADEAPQSRGVLATAWSAVTGLSEESVANRSRPVDFPDFTKGKWKTRSPIEIAGL